jgi:hypothetical protein
MMFGRVQDFDVKEVQKDRFSIPSSGVKPAPVFQSWLLQKSREEAVVDFM